MQSSGHNLSVVVPVYNSERTLPLLVARLAVILPEIAADFEVLLIDDGSKDQSWSAISQLCDCFGWVRGIRLMRNFGQHNAVLCGLRAAKYDVVVTLDDDLQHPPEHIPTLLARLNEGYDVVYGVPERQQHGLFRDLASVVTKSALQSAMGADIARNLSAFRAVRTQVRDAFSSFRSPYVSVDVLLSWATTRFSAVQVPHSPRAAGVSNYTFRKLVTHAITITTGFSTWPLQLASSVGFTFTVFGLCALFYVVGRYLLTGGSVPGFPFIASLVSILSGAQLFALGIIGEYLARMHFRMMDRPTYVVRVARGLELGNVSHSASGELETLRQQLNGSEPVLPLGRREI